MPENEKSTSARPSERQMQVLRDPAFVRVLADEVAVIDLGRDLELALLAAAPQVTKRVLAEDSDDDITVGFGFQPSMAETARVRITPQAAVSLVMSLLQNLLTSQHVKIDSMERVLTEMIRHARSEADQ